MYSVWLDGSWRRGCSLFLRKQYNFIITLSSGYSILERHIGAGVADKITENPDVISSVENDWSGDAHLAQSVQSPSGKRRKLGMRSRGNLT